MFRYLWRVLRARILRDVLKEVDCLSDTDLDAAREGAERAIQRRRWIPGELRLWLCAEVHDIPAATADEFKQAIRRLIKD